jgi:diaminopimelate decarboxylase
MNLSYRFFPSISKQRASIQKIVKNHLTPFFITQKSIVNRKLKKLNSSLKKHWGNNFTIAYSFKTNYDIAKNIKFSQAEVVSETELKLARSLKYQYQSIIFNGPNKGKIDHLLSRPLTINLDNFSEIQEVINYSKPIKATLGLRLNTNIHPSRFGFNIESGEAQKAISLLDQSHLSISGLHLHLGSDIHQTSLYQKTSQKIFNFIASSSLKNLDYIDFGGGFPAHGRIPGLNTQSDPNIAQYLKSITDPLQKLVDIQSLPTLILEPGRFFVDDSTVLIGRVIDQRQTNKQIITIDASINMLPSTWYRKQIVKTFFPDLHPKNTIDISTVIYGNTCQEIDCLYQGLLPKLSLGDLVVFYCVGAYNQSQTPDFIFKRPKTYFL